MKKLEIKIEMKNGTVKTFDNWTEAMQKVKSGEWKKLVAKNF